MFYNNQSQEIEKNLQQNTGATYINGKQIAPLWDRTWILNNLNTQMVELRHSDILYNSNNSLITVKPIQSHNWFGTCVKFGSLYFYKTTNIRTLTLTPIQPFVKFVNHQNIMAGAVMGPCKRNIHAVVLINNTQHNVGFMASSSNLSTHAALLPTKTYTNPNIFIDKEKIKYSLSDTSSAEKVAYLTILGGFKSLLRNNTGIEAITFETNNFMKINTYTQKWQYTRNKYTPHQKIELYFEQLFQANTSVSSIYSKDNFKISNIADLPKLSLEQRIKYIFDNHYPMWTTQQQKIASEYWLSPYNSGIHDEYDVLLKGFLAGFYE